MTSSSVRSARERLTRIASTVPDHVAAQREALAAIRHVVPFDVGTFATVDPATVLWTSCVLDGLDFDPHREAFMFDNEYRQDDLLKISDLARSPVPVGRLSAIESSTREGSQRYQLIRAYGALDELRCALVDGGTCWGSFEIYRSPESGPFTDEDAKAAASLSQQLAQLVRLALLRQAASLPAALDDPPGVIVVNRDGDIQAMSPTCQRWIDDAGTDTAVAPAFRSLAMSLTGNGDAVVSMMMPRSSGGWLRLHATRLDFETEYQVSIVIEPVKPPVLPETVAHVYGFTPRECEVITWIARGLSSKEIGTRLDISPFTVNDHTKAVFRKAGVQSRQQLIAALFFEHCLPLRERQAIPGPYGWFLGQD